SIFYSFWLTHPVSTLFPYTTLFRSSGASSAYNLYLVQPSETGKYAVNNILVKINAGSPYEAAFYCEFLRSYMAGEWVELPDIRLIGGIRPPPLTVFRQHGPNAWMSYPDWDQRSTLGKCLMWVFVPLWTMVLWPFNSAAFPGGKLGWIPEFSKKDLDDAAYDPANDGPMPEALARKIQQAPEPHTVEKWLYLFSLLVGGLPWIGILLLMVQMVVGGLSDLSK